MTACLQAPSPATDADASPNGGTDMVSGRYFTFGNDLGSIDLTAAGALDWVHWGDQETTDLNRKSGVEPTIGSYSLLGSGFELRTNDCCGEFSWTDGQPVSQSDGIDGGLLIDTANPQGDGYAFSVAAEPTMRRLRVYAGGWCARFRMVAGLVGTEAGYVDGNLDIPSPAVITAVYEIDFRSAAEAGELGVVFTMDENHCLTDDVGEVFLFAAALE